MIARRLLIALLATLLYACGGGGGGGYGSNSAPPAPQPPSGSPPPPQFTWRSTYGAQRGTTYGYLWWLAQPPATVATFAWGHGGQFAYVVPSLDLVVVATTNWQGLTAETDPTAFAGTVLTIIVNDVLPAARL